jgi:hypothetical protein
MIHPIQICQIFANLKLQIASPISSNQIKEELNLIKSNERIFIWIFEFENIVGNKFDPLVFIDETVNKEISIQLLE